MALIVLSLVAISTYEHCSAGYLKLFCLICCSAGSRLLYYFVIWSLTSASTKIACTTCVNWFTIPNCAQSQTISNPKLSPVPNYICIMNCLYILHIHVYQSLCQVISFHKLSGITIPKFVPIYHVGI